MSPPGRPKGEFQSAQHEGHPVTANADPQDPPAPGATATPIEATRRWVDKAVIGLNLCPFAKAVVARGQLRIVESAARDGEALTADLLKELHHLVDTDAALLDTTLLVAPQVYADFEDFNNFLDVCDLVLDELQLDGVVQIASFHPDYRFADTAADDIANATNRAPYPTLHLLREASVERAVDSHPDTDEIVERNVETLRRLGPAGWRALWD